MTIGLNSDDLRNVLLAIVALSTCVTTAITAYSKAAQRKRDEKKAIFDKAVAERVQEVKSTLVDATTKSATSIGEVRTEVQEARGQIEKVHTIVNSEKTRGMEELQASRLLTLSMAQAIAKDHPESESAQMAVHIAQTLYNKITQETSIKLGEDEQANR